MRLTVLIRKHAKGALEKFNVAYDSFYILRRCRWDADTNYGFLHTSVDGCNVEIPINLTVVTIPLLQPLVRLLEMAAVILHKDVSNIQAIAKR